MKTRNIFFNGMMIAAVGFLMFMASCEGKPGVDEEPAPGLAAPVSTIKLVRLDGTELDLASKPIPRTVNVKVSFDLAIASDERATIEGGFILKQGEGAVEKTIAWADDGKSFIATPARRLKYNTLYTVGMDPAVSSGAAAASFVTALSRDINGDGYADIVVGAPGADNDGDYRGKAYIFFGSSGGINSYDLSSQSANVEISGETDKEGLGGSISIAGDVNADGYADIIIGAGGNPVESAYPRGHAYVFHGGPSLSSSLSAASAITVLAGEGEHDMFGKSVAIVGDNNGDGFDDVFVGAPYASDSSGKVYKYSGSVNGIKTTPDGSSSGSEKSRVGWSVSAAGDINADGNDDAIIGAPGQMGYKGYFLVLHPAPAPGVAAGVASQIRGQVDSFLGSSVSNAGDVNADGYDDIIVSAPGLDSGKGKAYIFSGSSSGIAGCDFTGAPPCTPAVTITGLVDGGLLGSVSAAGDVNKDGISDVILGEPGMPVSPSTTHGHAHIFYGGASLAGDKSASAANATIIGRALGNMLGSVVSTAGDVNGDGIDDVFVGAPRAAGAKGEVYIFLGSTSGINECVLSSSPPCSSLHATIKGANADDFLGFGCKLMQGHRSTRNMIFLFFIVILPFTLILSIRKKEFECRHKIKLNHMQ